MVWKANDYLEHTQKVRSNKYETWATSMLVTDIGGEMCCRQLWDDGYGFGRFCHHISFGRVKHQYPKDVNEIEIPSPTHINYYHYNNEMKYLGMKNGIGKTQIQDI